MATTQGGDSLNGKGFGAPREGGVTGEAPEEGEGKAAGEELLENLEGERHVRVR